MPDRHITVLKDEGPFLVAKLSEQEQPGVYLSAGYLVALRQVLTALQAAAARSNGPETGEAVARLASMLEVLFNAQRAAAPQEWLDIEAAQREFERLVAELNGGGDGPRRA
jgi:hypothetical protein